MNQQIAIDFEPRMLARTHDPDTSFAAASRVAEFAGNHHEIILRVLRDFGPCTAHEIAAHCDIDSHRILKRLAELETAGLIAVVKAYGKDMTRPSPSGRPARVWFAVDGCGREGMAG